jgi:hypothetical protein
MEIGMAGAKSMGSAISACSAVSAVLEAIIKKFLNHT